ncbi:hypothetical protein D3C87_1910620 [compost metagenome]
MLLAVLVDVRALAPSLITREVADVPVARSVEYVTQLIHVTPSELPSLQFPVGEDACAHADGLAVLSLAVVDPASAVTGAPTQGVSCSHVPHLCCNLLASPL